MAFGDTGRGAAPLQDARARNEAATGGTEVQKRDTILLVDDVEMNRVILAGLFEDEYQILQAENGEQALLLLKQYHGSLVVMLLDVVMPVKDGYQVLAEMRADGLLDEVPAIVITAENSLESELRAFDLGASDIIVKPFEPHVVTRRVRNIIELSLHKHNLESMVEEQAEKLRESNEILIDALSSVIEYRSMESGQHIRRIRLLTKALLQEVQRNCPEYGLSDHKVDLIAAASAMHDIGKIAIPDSILNKPGRLTAEEFETMKTHTVKGCEILGSLGRISDQEYLQYAYNICRYHHERWDGRGYPDGLCGDAIPVCAQATGVADVYDALTSDRVYKKAIPHEQAVNMILNGECGIFSPKLIECFKSVIDQFDVLRRQYEDGQAPAAAHLPHTDPVSVSVSALQLEQMKYIAVLRHENATVLEVDFTTGSYHLVYTGMAGVQNLFRGSKLRDVLDQHIGRLVAPGDQAWLRAAWEGGMSAFFEAGRFQQSWRYRVKYPGGGDWCWCEMVALRIDTDHPHGRKALLLWKVLEDGAAPPPAPGCEGFLRDILNGVLRCRNDRYMTVEEAHGRLLGYTREEVRTRFHDRFIEMVYPDDRARVRKQMAQQLDAGVQYETEHRLIGVKGEPVWVLHRGRRVADGDGEHLYSVLVDINRSKQAEEALRMSLERYRIVMDQTNDVIFEWDMATDCVTYSTNWKEKFGYEPIRERASILLPTVSHLHPDDMADVGRFIRSMEHGKPYEEIDFRVSNAEGRYQWCRLRATAQFDSEGQTCRVIGVLSDINDAKRAQQELQAQAERDALTKLLNKQSARNRIESYLSQGGTHGAVLFIIDIDDFKLVNDRYGHMFGDAVLGNVATAIAQLFRGEDIVARIGGDEFMVALLNGMDGGRVEAVARRIVGCFERALQDLPSNCHVSCSVGISRAPQHGKDFQTLFQRADMALYQAKAHGKNQFQLYDPSMEGVTFGQAAPLAVASRTEIDSDQNGPDVLSDLVTGVFRMLNGAENLDRAIDMILELVGRRLGVGRAYLFESSADGRSCSNTHEWCAEGVAPQIGTLQNIPYASLSVPYSSLFNEQGVFYCNDVSALPADIAALLEPQGVQSMLQCAMRHKGRFCGWVGFDDCERRVLWTQPQIEVLLFIAEMLMLFLRNRGLGGTEA